MTRNPMEGGVTSPQDQLYQNGQAADYGGSEYQQNGYRQAIGLVALRAAEALMRERRISEGNSDGATEVLKFPAQDVASPSLPGGAVAVEQSKTKEKELPVLANVYCDPKRRTVSLLLDEATANTVMYAVRLFAAESEACPGSADGKGDPAA
jgi:hypothetical protein